MHAWEPIDLGRPCREAPGLALTAREIHVWRIDLPGVLEHKARGHAYARRRRLEILAAYAIEAEVAHEPGGRPTIDGHDIQVSASYAEGIALFALARRPLGIDVERQRDIAAAEVIARSYFAPAEYARWRTERLPQTRFLQYWTRKEAYLKALGRGFEHPSQAVDASCGGGGDLIFNALDGFESLRWAVRSFRPDREHTASIVHARGPGISFRWLRPLAG